MASRRSARARLVGSCFPHPNHNNETDMVKLFFLGGGGQLEPLSPAMHLDGHQAPQTHHPIEAVLQPTLASKSPH